jgi:glycosyltransferase 2 family protein
VFLSALGLSSAISSTPGYIGVYQFAAVTVLAPFGISKSTALVFILISEIANYEVVSFWGNIRVLENKQSNCRLKMILMFISHSFE